MPLNDKDAVSEGGKVYFKQNYTRPVNYMEFSEGKILSKNYGSDVSLDKLSSDQESFTGQQEGFFKKFGSNKVS